MGLLFKLTVYFPLQQNYNRPYILFNEKFNKNRFLFIDIPKREFSFMRTYPGQTVVQHRLTSPLFPDRNHASFPSQLCLPLEESAPSVSHSKLTHLFELSAQGWMPL